MQIQITLVIGILSAIFLGTADAGTLQGCWRMESKMVTTSHGSLDVTNPDCTVMFYSDKYAMFCSGMSKSRWTTFELESSKIPNRYMHRQVCEDPMRREPCDYDNKLKRTVAISMKSDDELVLAFDKTQIAPVYYLTFSRSDDSACVKAFPSSDYSVGYRMMKSHNDRAATGDRQRNAQNIVASRLAAAREQSPRVIGERIFTADQLRPSISVGGGCRPWIRGVPGFEPKSSQSFFHTVEILPGVTANELGGGLAMVVPKTGKIYPVKLSYTQYLEEGDKSGWVKGYMYRDAFGEVKCLID